MNGNSLSRLDCQVLVVGAGPTGLVLAAELLARGIHTRIIDKGDGVALQTRAIGIHARTLEVLDMMGLAERFVEHGQVVHVYVSYPPGPLARLDRFPGGLRAGQRTPDIQVRTGRRPATLYSVLRGGRHVLVVPAAHPAGILGDPGLRPFLGDLDVVTGPRDFGAGTAFLIRPDGHVAARGRLGGMEAVTGYLRDLFRSPQGAEPMIGGSGCLIRTHVGVRSMR